MPKQYERETYRPQGRKPYTQEEREERIVLSLISEKDTDKLISIMAWPIKWAGIILVSLVLCLGIPLVTLALIAWGMGYGP